MCYVEQLLALLAFHQLGHFSYGMSKRSWRFSSSRCKSSPCGHGSFSVVLLEWELLALPKNLKQFIIAWATDSVICWQSSLHSASFTCCVHIFIPPVLDSCDSFVRLWMEQYVIIQFLQSSPPKAAVTAIGPSITTPVTNNAVFPNFFNIFILFPPFYAVI